MNQPQTPLPFPIRYEVVSCDGHWFVVVRRPGNRVVIGSSDERFARLYARDRNMDERRKAGR